ncbi:MAG TPA: monofunctional biosynthetic peptidoglycan transglycosylase [Rhizomicrobium sp.]|jgi:monofunctional biosynthetic peptidoglycan transglycosylase|nr:monofunctional biosynthetic peptidoglycan transglycosylase [Rhizomicrobium sp.]
MSELGQHLDTGWKRFTGLCGRVFARLWWRRDGKTPWVKRIFVVLFTLFVPLPIISLLLFRIVPIPYTPQMAINLITLNPVRYHWVDYMPPALGRAVIGSEDQNFCKHHGFDWAAIDKAIKKHERHPKRTLHGASTISQQTARSVFLVPTRSWVRKGIEAYLTVLMEALWPKERILTAYLNTVDWGNGNFGADAAAYYYFGKPAAALSSVEASRLAAILPNPTRYSAAKPGPYVRKRTAAIGTKIHQVTRDSLDWCVR